MSKDSLIALAALIRTRNAVDENIAALIGRPATSGHLGEWVASQIFDIELEASASAKAIDGRFRSGPLTGKTVNVKYLGKREGVLDTNEYPELDYYLVMTGPRGTAMSSKGGTRPWCITNVYLFDANHVRADQTQRGIKSGIGASMRAKLWADAEIYPVGTALLLPLESDQIAGLDLFGP